MPYAKAEYPRNSALDHASHILDIVLLGFAAWCLMAIRISFWEALFWLAFLWAIGILVWKLFGSPGIETLLAPAAVLFVAIYGELFKMKTEIANVRTEMSDLRGYVRSEITELKGDLKLIKHKFRIRG